eukprot:GGOE01011379.1.p8 GENE.GGOE01011379.1~~GGOE01011379.1.p8  ORF type:complete len:107 (-),score=1.07 GGOE01011379.1:730-1050(-)
MSMGRVRERNTTRGGGNHAETRPATSLWLPARKVSGDYENNNMATSKRSDLNGVLGIGIPAVAQGWFERHQKRGGLGEEKHQTKEKRERSEAGGTMLTTGWHTLER